MTPEGAAQIARVLYEDHPAAAALILEAIGGASKERRFRSAQALRWLCPDEDVEELPLPPREDAALRALRWCLYGRRLRDRKHAATDAARLLQELTE